MSFSSGSCGNCYYLGTDDGRGLLIDAGVSLRRMKQALNGSGLTMDDFSSILLTHDHMDHARNIGSYCKRICRPVYATSVLHDALSHRSSAMPHIVPCRRDLPEGVWTDIDGFLVRSFIVPHDATQTVGYAIVAQGHKFVIMTDMGRMTEEAEALASQADTVVIESNYDLDMLMSGPYTHELKMRICRGSGHLSNDECASAIKRFWHKGLKNIFLCHLSENNNTPSAALKTSSGALAEIGVPQGEVSLRALPRNFPSPLYFL